MIITHRLAAAGSADRILVMDKGRIAEAGSHEELLEKQGMYYEMYRMQKEMYYRTT